MKVGSLLLAGLLLATAGGFAPGGGSPIRRSVEQGQLLSRPDMLRLKVLGVALGMTPAAADAQLTAQGFKPLGQFGGRWSYLRPAKDATRGSDDFRFSTAGEGPSAVIESIEFRRALNWRDVADIEARRQEVIDAYGRPTLWRKLVLNRDIHDEMIYATRKALLDEGASDQVKSCAVDWKCPKVNVGLDCRRYATPNAGAVLTVRFDGGGVIHELQDFTRRYDVLSRDPAFQRLDVAGADCAPRPVE